MVEIALIAIAVALLYIAYALARMRTAILDHIRHSMSPLPRTTTLNPVFSEYAIANIQELIQHWSQQAFEAEERYFKQEQIEIDLWRRAQTTVEFEPSGELLRQMREAALAEVLKGLATRDRQRMIEANISVLRGTSIGSVESEYSEGEADIPYDSVFMTVPGDAESWLNEPEVEEKFQSHLALGRVRWSVEAAAPATRQP